MNQWRINFLISRLALTLTFLIIFFPSASLAQETPQETREKKCISCCEKKQIICYNLTADRRLCYAEYLECVETCKSEGKSSSEWRECWDESGHESKKDE